MTQANETLVYKMADLASELLDFIVKEDEYDFDIDALKFDLSIFFGKPQEGEYRTIDVLELEASIDDGVYFGNEREFTIGVILVDFLERGIRQNKIVILF